MLKDTEEHDQASPDGKGDTGEPDVIPMAVASFLESRAAEWYRMAKVFTDDAKKDVAMRCNARAVVYETIAERARIERWVRVAEKAEVEKPEVVEFLGENGGQACDMKQGPCSCGAWH